jgi:glycosyltransferase involved in cell wall biosynthesis
VARIPPLRRGVSVVVPVKDRAHLLAQTLKSVREQSMPIDEVIVVDDGSTDQSAAVAREGGATVLALEGESHGPAAARNEGLANVRTELACPLDSDDLLRPNALQGLTDALAGSSGAPFAFGEALEAAREPDGWHPTGIVAPLDGELEDLPCSLYARNFVPASSVVLRTREALSAGGYPAWLGFNEDHYLWIQLARRAPPAHVPEVLGVARRHRGSRHDPLAHAAAEEVTRLADDDPRLIACRPERLGVQLLNMATAAVRAHRPREAARIGRDLLLRQPHRGRILRSAGRWWRTRRVSAREARELWSADPALRSFLESYE